MHMNFAHHFLLVPPLHWHHFNAETYRPSLIPAACHMREPVVQRGFNMCCACGVLQKIKWKKLAAEALRANKGKFQMKVCSIAAMRQRLIP